MSLIIYDEDKCPRDIRATIKSLFFDFDIILVEEVQNRKGTVFIFYLQDKSSIRIVRVNNENEVEVLQEFDRQAHNKEKPHKAGSFQLVTTEELPWY